MTGHQTVAIQDYRDGLNACFDGEPFSLRRSSAWRSAYQRASEQIAQMKAVCPECGVEFFKNNSHQKYCSDQHRVFAGAKRQADKPRQLWWTPEPLNRRS